MATLRVHPLRLLRNGHFRSLLIPLKGNGFNENQAKHVVGYRFITCWPETISEKWSFC